MEGQTTTLAEALQEVQRLIRMGDYRHAGGLTYQLVEQAPDNPPVLALHGTVLARLGRYDEAVPFIERALDAQPEPTVAIRLTNELAQLRMNQGRTDDAIAVLDRGLESNPDAPFLIGTKTEAMLFLGRRDEAEKFLSAAIERGVTHISVAMALARLRLTGGDPKDAIDALTPFVEQPGLAASQLAMALGRLGELHDRAGNYEQAFACHRRAANLIPAEFDTAAHSRAVSTIIQNWTPANVAKVKRPDDTSTAPVFIVGMPRSGTSLVEQILSCHPDVFACGELDTMFFIARKILGGTADTFRPLVEKPTAIKGKQLEVAAQVYEQKLTRTIEREARNRGQEPPAHLPKRVTDKQPLNFYNLGPIALMFPEAHVIHCVRDPRDTCLSCYFSQFTNYHPYAYDLENLAAYYRDYDRLMKHWTSALTKAPINLKLTELRYESLVADQEGETRRLLEFLGLPWDDACLRHHESDRVTRTLSNDQVRKPVYAGSVGRYKHYAKHIKSLTDALGDLLPDAG
ncbi:MAG: sulfotransferase [Phycisphaerales bacterium]